MELIITTLVYFITGSIITFLSFRLGYRKGRSDESNIFRGDLREEEALWDRWEK